MATNSVATTATMDERYTPADRMNKLRSLLDVDGRNGVPSVSVIRTTENKSLPHRNLLVGSSSQLRKAQVDRSAVRRTEHRYLRPVNTAAQRMTNWGEGDREFLYVGKFQSTTSNRLTQQESRQRAFAAGIGVMVASAVFVLRIGNPPISLVACDCGSSTMDAEVTNFL